MVPALGKMKFHGTLQDTKSFPANSFKKCLVNKIK